MSVHNYTYKRLATAATSGGLVVVLQNLKG